MLDSSAVGDPFQNDPFAKPPSVMTGIYIGSETLQNTSFLQKYTVQRFHFPYPIVVFCLPSSGMNVTDRINVFAVV